MYKKNNNLSHKNRFLFRDFQILEMLVVTSLLTLKIVKCAVFNTFTVYWISRNCASH